MGDLSPEELSRASICTRYMLAPEFRKSGLAYKMLKAMYILAIENGSTSCYIDTNDPLVSMFEKIGCRTLFRKNHPDYGDVTVMRLDGLDIDHLMAVRSPFAPICRRFLERRESGKTGSGYAARSKAGTS